MYSKYKSRSLTLIIGWNKIYNVIPKARKVRKHRTKAQHKRAGQTLYSAFPHLMSRCFFTTSPSSSFVVWQSHSSSLLSHLQPSEVWLRVNPLLKSLPRAKSHYVLEPWGQDFSLTATSFVILFCNFFIDSLESLHHAPQFHSPPSPPYSPAACAPTVK